MTDDLQRLVERIEGEMGPSFVLDCNIGRVLRPERESWPAYTASLDAAMTLVDGDLLGFAVDVNQYDRWSCELSTSITDGNGKGATPALALCAASLRARITERTNHG